MSRPAEPSCGGHSGSSEGTGAEARGPRSTSPGVLRAAGALASLAVALPACGGGEGEDTSGPAPRGEEPGAPAEQTTTAPTGSGTDPTSAEPLGWASCANHHWGYTVDYPSDWYTTSLDARTRCTWFARERFELERGTDGPLVDLEVRATIGSFQQAARQLQDPFGERVVAREGLLIHGLQTIRFEKEQTEDLLYPVGTRSYGYLLNHDGAAYWILTFDVPGQALPYDANKEVVDRAARSLSFRQGAQ